MLAFVPLLAAVEVGIDNTVFKTHTHPTNLVLCFVFFSFSCFRSCFTKAGVHTDVYRRFTYHILFRMFYTDVDARTPEVSPVSGVCLLGAWVSTQGKSGGSMSNYQGQTCMELFRLRLCSSILSLLMVSRHTGMYNMANFVDVRNINLPAAYTGRRNQHIAGSSAYCSSAQPYECIIQAMTPDAVATAAKAAVA